MGECIHFSLAIEKVLQIGQGGCADLGRVDLHALKNLHHLEQSVENIPFQIDKNGTRGIICASKIFFERDCVLAVANLYSKKYLISIQPKLDSEFEIFLTAKDGSIITDFFLKQVANDLIDQQIRLDMQREFGELRNKIVDYAFYSIGDRRV